MRRPLPVVLTAGLLAVQDGHTTPDVSTGGEPRPNTNLMFLDAGVLINRPRA